MDERQGLINLISIDSYKALSIASDEGSVSWGEAHLPEASLLNFCVVMLQRQARLDALYAIDAGAPQLSREFLRMEVAKAALQGLLTHYGADRIVADITTWAPLEQIAVQKADALLEALEMKRVE